MHTSTRLLLISCLLLNGCMVGPNYKDPKLIVSKQWLQTSPNKKATVSAGKTKTVDWWKAFADPTLTSLIDKGYHNNLTLQIAGVRVLQTRAQLAQSVGELYPQQQAMTGNYTYERIGGSSLQSLLPSSFLMASLGFSASWELDFWGKYRRAIQSNDATFLASIAAYDNALVILTADIASAYINIRTSQELIRVTQENIGLQRMSLKIARSRYNAGQTSMLDVDQAETELGQTQASLPPLYNTLQHQKDMLAVLLGTVPTDVDKLLTSSKGIPRTPRRMEVGIPREDLVQRPDIYQARMEAVAQSEAIGAVKANLFPSLSLLGSFSFSSTNIGKSSISDMFNWANRSISAGPSLTWPLLNYGQITNAVRMQDAAFQEALLNYINAVLRAQQEVQDNISSYIQSQRAEYYLTMANKSAIASTKLALIRYKEGETDYTTVLDVEKQQLQVQTSLTQAKGNIALALVGIYRSLGGGWQIRQCNDFIAQNIKADMAKRTNWGSLLEQKNHQRPTTKKQRAKQLYLPNW